MHKPRSSTKSSTKPRRNTWLQDNDPSEHSIQAKLVDILPAMMKPGIVRLSIPNGGLRHPRVGMMLKAEGLVPGSPDLVFALPGGLVAWLEMKKLRGAVRDDQLGLHAKLKRLGHTVEIADSVESALEYLDACGILK